MRIQICLKPCQIIHSISDCVSHIAKDISAPIKKPSLKFYHLLIQHIYGRRPNQEVFQASETNSQSAVAATDQSLSGKEFLLFYSDWKRIGKWPEKYLVKVLQEILFQEAIQSELQQAPSRCLPILAESTLLGKWYRWFSSIQAPNSLTGSLATKLEPLCSWLPRTTLNHR